MKSRRAENGDETGRSNAQPFVQVKEMLQRLSGRDVQNNAAEAVRPGQKRTEAAPGRGGRRPRCHLGRSPTTLPVSRHRGAGSATKEAYLSRRSPQPFLPRTAAARVRPRRGGSNFYLAMLGRAKRGRTTRLPREPTSPSFRAERLRDRAFCRRTRRRYRLASHRGGHP